MNIDVICGCAYGSEGKGLVAGMLVTKNQYDWIISVNSAQAGHTVIYNGKPIVTRHLPSGAVIDHQANILIGAGAVINKDVLDNEIRMLEENGIPILERLYVHGLAVVIRLKSIEKEERERMFDRLGSTCEGVGETNAERAMRRALTFRESPLFINGDLVNVFSDDIMFDRVRGDILLEGSQGFALSLFDMNYPKCTSRDTTVSAFLSYARLSPRNLRHVYGVFRTFPIRVAGNSGWMYREQTWEDIARYSGYEKLSEKTTVTQRIRRVGLWDKDLAKRAMIINGVDRPILTFANYLDREFESCPDKINRHQFDRANRRIFEEMEQDIGKPWFAISTSRKGDWWFNNKYY